MEKHYDVAIIGAGPAGTSCALALRHAGLKVALIDKDTFPRDKTCGDAIPGPALKYLKNLLDESEEAFETFESKQRIKTSTIFMNNGASLNINWKTKAYNSKRIDFDNFLAELVKRHTETSIYEGFIINAIQKENQKISIKSKTSNLKITCQMVIGSDGANSIVARSLNRHTNGNIDGVAIRAYFENVSCAPNTNEFFLLRDFPGYFWIFPTDEKNCNVGMGTLDGKLPSSFRLKDHFQEVIQNDPVISPKFKGATMKSKVVGFKLPLGGKRKRISGQHFLLTGDAAHLVDPLQGHGIDKAIKSGQIAAQHIERCFDENDFSEAFNAQYDDAIYRAMGKELAKNFKLMKLSIRYPWIIKLAFPIIKHNKERLLKAFYN